MLFLVLLVFEKLLVPFGKLLVLFAGGAVGWMLLVILVGCCWCCLVTPVGAVWEAVGAVCEAVDAVCWLLMMLFGKLLVLFGKLLVLFGKLLVLFGKLLVLFGKLLVLFLAAQCPSVLVWADVGAVGWLLLLLFVGC